jgi:hypothetical protein
VGAFAIVALIQALPAHAAEATGKWQAEFDTQIGVQKYTFDLKAADGKLTGTALFERMGESGQVELKEGKVEGDKVFFVELFEMQGNQIRIEYTGQIVGDEIKITRKVGEFATEELVAKRVKE